MQQSGLNRIEKKSKQDALSVLTQGFATIEQGLKLFDQVTNSPITIITEGDNAHLISKALELFEITDVEVLLGCESVTGDKQLRTLFEFFSRTNHANEVIFVWDCDVNIGRLESQNKTHPFKFETNPNNSLTNKGIENLFEESLFEGFIHTARNSHGQETRTFDNGRKRDFKNHIVNRSQKSDFNKFQPLFDFIATVKESRTQD